MATLSAKCEVSKETYELLIGVARLVEIVKNQVADGWQPGIDIPVIIASAIGDLVPAIQGVEKIKEEIAENKVAFGHALLLGAAEIVRKAG